MHYTEIDNLVPVILAVQEDKDEAFPSCLIYLAKNLITRPDMGNGISIQI